MKLSILSAFAFVFATTGHAQADDRTAAAIYFHNLAKSACGFNITPESAEKAVATLGTPRPGHDPLLVAVLELCLEIKKGNKSKTIEVQVPDSRKVQRKVVLEKGKWWQG
ncbi:hypothetical protein [Rhizobium leguminosarum]